MEKISNFVTKGSGEPIQTLESEQRNSDRHHPVMPQSWFNEQEPMRGDLHHLFTCEPVCNSIRSNYTYHDFADYNQKVRS
ncbi:endonuclease I [Virgibacillus natechei]|uniref:Endonuclease I n=1 Tax=Virgibacillus natechei TaxID=1216297 RepID=A0ABS4IIT9_9BACI|nr:endonuclease I [Virgibacillus natechei]